MYKMYRINAILFMLVLYCATTCSKGMTEIEALGAKPNHCTYEYAYDMYGAHCADLRLSKIPSLRSGIEILDFSDNKLQELTGDTLSSYTSIKFLYLADNQIYLIEDDALSSLTDLQTLDLSNNVILELPKKIFQLPSLRKLYLRGNPLIHMSLNDLVSFQPVKAPLELLDLSNCRIKVLPKWGILSQLIFYNISHNPLISIDPHHFSSMCNLGKVDITDSIDNIKICDLKPTIMWFQNKSVYFELADYSRLNSGEYESCPVLNGTHMNINNATFNLCKAELLQVQNIKAARKTWLTISGSLFGFLVGFILLLYIMHRHNVAQTKKPSPEKLKETKKPSGDADKRATVVLLDNMS